MRLCPIPVLTFFATLSLAHAEATSSASAGNNTIETAKRDLQALDVRGQDAMTTGKGLGVEIPHLSTFNDTLAPFSAPRGESASRVSGNGEKDSLLGNGKFDGMASVKFGDRARADDAFGTDRDLAVAGSANRSSLVVNPLDRFLTEWLSPQDRGLLHPPEKKASHDVDAPAAPRAKPASAGLDDALAIGRPMRSNPYLDQNTLPDFNRPYSGSGHSFDAPPPPKRASLRPMSLYPSDASTDHAKPNSSIAPSETALPLPTAPLIDERKYFPQFGRF